jgi:hypothetical protein
MVAQPLSMMVNWNDPDNPMNKEARSSNAGQQGK